MIIINNLFLNVYPANVSDSIRCFVRFSFYFHRILICVRCYSFPLCCNKCWICKFLLLFFIYLMHEKCCVSLWFVEFLSWKHLYSHHRDEQNSHCVVLIVDFDLKSHFLMHFILITCFCFFFLCSEWQIDEIYRVHQHHRACVPRVERDPLNHQSYQHPNVKGAVAQAVHVNHLDSKQH